MSDTAHHRVLRVRKPLTNPGGGRHPRQTVYTGTSCNQGAANPTASTLCLPGGIRLDHQGNLYVADHSLEASGNFRTLRWDVSQIPVNPAACVFAIPATAVYGMAGNFKHCLLQQQLRGMRPLGTQFHLGRQGHGERDERLCGFAVPLAFSDPATGDHYAARLNDYGSMFFASTFDEQDNLYISDLDRGRVLIYLKPFETPFRRRPWFRPLPPTVA